MKNRTFYSLFALCLLMILPFSGRATDGYFSNGQGTRAKGFAGGGIAFLRTPFAAANNPAALSFIDSKWSFEVAVGLFNPNRKYTVNGLPTSSMQTFGLNPGTYESGSSFFVIPSLAIAYQLGEKNSLGFNFYGNGGMNTDYDTKTYYNDVQYQLFGGDANPQNPFAGISQPTGVNIQQLFLSLTYARQLGEKHSIGISPIFVYQTFEAGGLEAFRNFGMAGGPPRLDVPDRSAFVTGNGQSTSTGFGVRIGYQGEIIEGLRLGASFQPRIDMTPFDEYKGLFAEEGDFDIPMNWTAGVSYDINEDVTILFDVKQIYYSDVNSVGNPMIPANMLPGMFDAEGNFAPNPNFIPLGDENAAGFGWKDMTMFKVGAEFRQVEDWEFRFGYSYGEQPIPETEVLFNILAPAVNSHHLSLGFTRMIGDKALNFAVTHALANTVSGPNPFDPAQTVDLEMNQWEFELGFNF
ncbi:MAG TPA: hypothetical protein DDX92_13850 [Flavobacteriales bacterium]|jgi:long-chain fatty acid transport protein|nr:hypothetical protein [Flavobacteriales bacterium]